MMTSVRSLAVWLFLTSACGAQYKEPPLTMTITAPSATELLVSWEPPATASDVDYYTLTVRDVIANKVDKYKYITNSSYRLTDLTASRSYTVTLSCYGKSCSSLSDASRTVVPKDLYKLEPLPRLPAMLIFYSTICSAILIYVVVVAILIAFACLRKRNRSSFTVSASRQDSHFEGPSMTESAYDAVQRYSKLDQMDRVSTFTGSSVNNSRVVDISENVYNGYEMPISSYYLHPRADVGEPPALPARNPVTNPDEHVYQEPKETYRSSKNRPGTKPMNAPVKKKQSTSKLSKSLGRQTLPKMNSCLSRNNSMTCPGDEVPVSSRALVQRNDSMRSVTIHTDMGVGGAVSCPAIPVSLLDEIGDGIQITLTLKSKSSAQK